MIYKILEKKESKNISELNILLNNYCNLQCRYCYFTNNNGTYSCTRKHLFKLIKIYFQHIKIDNDIERLLCFNADGEVLLNSKTLLECIKYSDSLINLFSLKKINIVVVTNGTLLNSILAEQFKKYNVTVTISIDGNASINDCHRLNKKGESSYYDVIRGVDILKRFDVPFFLRSVVTPQTLKKINSAYESLKNLEPKLPIKFRAVRNQNYPFYTQNWIKKYAKGYKNLIINLLNKESIVDVDDLKYFYEYLTHKKIRKYYCSAGKSMLWMNPYGYFSICGLLSLESKYSVGHIDKINNPSDLIKMLNHPIATMFERNALSEKCRPCKWINACAGGCPAFPTISNDKNYRPLCKFYSEIGETIKKFL